MATIEKRGNRWRARVRRGGIDLSESFRTKTQAQAWATKIEADIDAGKLVKSPDKTVCDLLLRYLKQVLEPRGSRADILRVLAFCGMGQHVTPDPLSQVRLPDLRPSHIAEWRDRRMQEVKPSTVLREWATLSAAFSVAVREWGWLPENPMSKVRRPEPPQPRSRRVTDDEIERLIIAGGYSRDDPPRTVQARVLAAFLFAIETAMRVGEICALRWSDVDLERRTARVRAEDRGARKTGVGRTVPLSSEAVRIVEQVRAVTHDATRVFDLTPPRVDATFRKIRERAMLPDLHFHDSRAEALTRLSKKLDVMQLARVSGHSDIGLLYRVYYREQPEDFVKLLD